VFQVGHGPPKILGGWATMHLTPPIFGPELSQVSSFKYLFHVCCCDFHHSGSDAWLAKNFHLAPLQGSITLQYYSVIRVRLFSLCV
jgi:hypothetical protein